MRVLVRDSVCAIWSRKIMQDGAGPATRRAGCAFAYGTCGPFGDRARALTATRAFTLIELLAVVAILAILLAVAIPSFAPMLNSNRLFAIQTEVISSLALARSEAAKRGVPVSMVSSTASGVVGNEWGPGWFVWVDSNANGVVDSGEVLRAHEALSSGLTLSVPNSGVIKFDSHGYLSPALLRQLKVCSAARGTSGYQITIQPNGLVDSASATCP
ncbi:prepilin-type N-terminal cleavage/methylation domain-containing protein [Ralstonia pickettii]|uniref:Type II secretion system protein H n=2 Tax=Ralstonia pickettii TaxID=329 RepID=A0A7X2HQX7_RALPI|nr:prepilin-type N-terminal cleavage/methylation domain-containing protein [Ralstonia pickettii]